MISNWRVFPPNPRQPEPPPEPEPHIWDEVTVDQAAKMQKGSEDTNTLVTSMMEHMTPEQKSTFDNYKKTREDSGRQAKVP